MTVVNVALLGAGGQLGRTLIADWQQQEAGTVVAPSGQGGPAKPVIRLYPFDRSELDICVPAQLQEKLQDLDLHAVVNAAAYTAVDKAESEADEAMRINRDGARAVAEWTAANGCRLIHVSTDFVFDGRTPAPYLPDAPTSPINRYGETKLAGEQAVRATCPDTATIIRTSWLYSKYQPNFLTTMLRLMNEKERLGVVADQLGTPTSTHSLARLIARAVSGEPSSGVFHWSDAGAASWYDFAVAIQEEALAAGLLQAAIPVDPISTADYPTPAARPAYSVLDKSASYQRFQLAPVHWRKELRPVIAELAEAEGRAVL